MILGVYQEEPVECIGILKVKVIQGTNLAVRDMLTSDPYVILAIGQQVSYFYLNSIILIVLGVI